MMRLTYHSANDMKKTLAFGFALAVVLTSMVVKADDNMVRDMRNEHILRKAQADTRGCMYDSVRMLVTQGIRDNTYIANWAANACGLPMHVAASIIKEFPKDTVNAMLVAMAYDEMQRIPGLVPHPKK